MMQEDKRRHLFDFGEFAEDMKGLVNKNVQSDIVDAFKEIKEKYDGEPRNTPM